MEIHLFGYTIRWVRYPRPELEKSNISLEVPLHYYSLTKPCNMEKYDNMRREEIEQKIEDYLFAPIIDSE